MNLETRTKAQLAKELFDLETCSNIELLIWGMGLNEHERFLVENIMKETCREFGITEDYNANLQLSL
jgi:hypothetical protein